MALRIVATKPNPALVTLPWEGLKLSQGEPAIPTVFLEP